jgi:hypothetical protein
MAYLFQELFHWHAEEPVKIAGGEVRRYAKQPYDPKWELIW